MLDFKKVSWQVYKEHLFSILKLTWPNILTSLIQLALPVSSTLAVGHIGPAFYIGAAALGNMFANATGFAVGSGMAMALDTLCSQAFGAKKYHLVGLHCQRAMCILTIACFPIAILWWNAGIVLQFIGDEETAQYSLYWIKRLLPSLWPRIMYETYRRYLLAQRVMWPMTVSVATVVPFHIINTYLFIYVFDWGFYGAAWATSISYWLLFTTLVSVNWIRLKVLRKRAANSHQKLTEMEDKLDGAELVEGEEYEGSPLDTWPAWSLDALRGWLGYFRLGIATTISLVIEWGSFEVNAAIASHLGEIPLAAHAIMSNSVSIWYAFPLGVATASTALVGNMLGSGEPDRAQIYARLAFMLALIYGIFNGAFGMLYRDFLGLAFTNNEAVVASISSVMSVMWVYGLVDAIKAVGMAVLRGSGRPSLTVYGNVLSCLLVGYPVALLLVYKADMGLSGLWLGMTSAWLCASIIYGTIVARTNWQAEVLKAAQRTANAMRSTQRGKMLEEKGMLMETVEESKEEKFSIVVGETEESLRMSGNDDVLRKSEGEKVSLLAEPNQE